LHTHTIATAQHSRLHFGLHSGEEVSELTVASNYDRHTGQSRGGNQAEIGIEVEGMRHSDLLLA